MNDPVTTKTYTELSKIPRASVGKCNAVLANHMQCWRAGDVQVVISTTDGETASMVSYQLCKAHAIYEQQQDALAAQASADLAKAQAEVAATESKK